MTKAPEEAAPGYPGLMAAGVGAEDEKLPGGPEDPAVAAVAAVNEKAVGGELLTPGGIVPSCGLPR